MDITYLLFQMLFKSLHIDFVALEFLEQLIIQWIIGIHFKFKLITITIDNYSKEFQLY